MIPTGIVHEDHRAANCGHSTDALGERFTVECRCGHRIGPDFTLRETLDAWGVHLVHETLTQALDRRVASHRRRQRAS